MSQINLPKPESFEIPEQRKPASSDKPGKTYSIPPTNFAQKMETHPHEKESMGKATPINFKDTNKEGEQFYTDKAPEDPDVLVLPTVT